MSSTSLIKLIAQLRELKEEKERLDKMEQELKEQAKEYMMDYGVSTFKTEYGTLVYKRFTKTVFDVDRFKLEHPDLYQKYTIQKPVEYVALYQPEVVEEDL